MSNKTPLPAALLAMLVALSGAPESLAQQPWLKERPTCQTAEEVLSGLRAEGKLPAAPGEILVEGSVTAPQSLPFRAPTTVAKVLATVGGVRRGASQRIYLFRQVPGEEPRVQTVIVDLGKMMRGRSPDVILAGGDAVYVPEGCTPTRPNRLVDPVRTVPPSVAEKPFKSRRRT